MTDITELAQSKSLRKKLNRRLNDAYGFQRTSGGKHTTISLSIAECKSAIAALDQHLALVEALEKAQETITQLESCTVKLPHRNLGHPKLFLLCPFPYYDAEDMEKALAAAGIKVEAE